jgi:signal transduction histidine kinase
MTVDAVLARIADNPRLPTPRALTLQVLERASHPNCSILEIGKMISVDPALCGTMLKLVNSSLYGLQSPVTSINRALNLLGLNHVRSLVLSMTLPSLRFHHATSEQMKTFWKSSVTTAIACREIASRRQMSDPDSEMVAGLLCDLGMLFIQESFPTEYAALTANPPEGWWDRQCEIEDAAFGVNHAMVIAYFLDRWKLGADMSEAIRWHHAPEQAPSAVAPRARLIHFASRIAQLQVSGGSSVLLGEIVELGSAHYGLDDAGLRAFLDDLGEKVAEFARLIDVDLGPCENFSDLFAKATANLTKLAVAASLDHVRIQEEKSQIEVTLRQATAALKSTEEQLRQTQKMEAIGRLAGGVAHDFNNLLTIILGNCELLLQAPIGEEPVALVEMIKQTGERAAALTRQLLTFSRKQLIEPAIVNLNEHIGNLSKMLRRLIGDDIRLVTRLADTLDRVKIDPSQFEQVLMNLAVNARDAMATGGTLTIETLNLRVAADLVSGNPDVTPGNYAVISVRDTGSGMNTETLARVFEPFFTTKEQGKGTGLGLATVHGIVHKAGGHITVSSAPGQGTVFHIYLPSVEAKLLETKPADGPPASRPRIAPVVSPTRTETGATTIPRVKVADVVGKAVFV